MRGSDGRERRGGGRDGGRAGPGGRPPPDPRRAREATRGAWAGVSERVAELCQKYQAHGWTSDLFRMLHYLGESSWELEDSAQRSTIQGLVGIIRSLAQQSQQSSGRCSPTPGRAPTPPPHTPKQQQQRSGGVTAARRSGDPRWSLKMVFPHLTDSEVDCALQQAGQNAEAAIAIVATDACADLRAVFSEFPVDHIARVLKECNYDKEAAANKLLPCTKMRDDDPSPTKFATPDAVGATLPVGPPPPPNPPSVGAPYPGEVCKPAPVPVVPLPTIVVPALKRVEEVMVGLVERGYKEHPQGYFDAVTLTMVTLPEREAGILRGQRRLSKRVADLGMCQSEMDGDGNCLFRSFSHQLWRTDEYYSTLRRKHPLEYQMYFDTEAELGQFIENVRQDKEWGDELSMRALCDALSVTVHVILSTEGNWYEPERGRSERDLFLSYISPCHYNSVIALSEQQLLRQAAEAKKGSRGGR